MPKKRRVSKAPAGDGRLRVVGYVRVSTEEQARDGSSLPNQEQRIKGYCDAQGLDLVRLEVDAGVSAKTLDRKGLAVILDDLGRGRIDGMVIAKLDRLTRSIRDWADLIDRFFSEKAGCRLFSVGDSIDTGTAVGRMVLNLIMTVAQWEREAIAERTRDVLQGKIRRGERCGRLRYGYDLAADGRTLVPNPHEQEAIAIMKAKRAQGMTYREVIEVLEGMGIETKEPGSIWRPGAIHRILARTVE